METEEMLKLVHEMQYVYGKHEGWSSEKDKIFIEITKRICMYQEDTNDKKETISRH